MTGSRCCLDERLGWRRLVAKGSCRPPAFEPPSEEHADGPGKTDANCNRQSFEDRVQAELEDNLDEELELELGDNLLARLPASIADTPQQEGFDRRRYFT